MPEPIKRTSWPLAAALAVTLLLAGFAAAQPALLPAETVFAAGLSGLAEHEARFQPFVDEFNRLGLGDSLQRLFADELNEGAADLPAGFEGLGLLDFLGDEAWLAVSVSPFNPLPAVTVVLHPSSEALAAISDQLASVESQPDTQTLTEGEHTFYFLPTDSGDDMPFLAGIAVSVAGDAMVMSSNPDVLRGVLRRVSGSDEPGFSANEHFIATQEITGSGDTYVFTDFAQLGQTAQTFLAPLAAQAGFETLLDQLVSALNTLGVAASSTEITADGTSSSGVQILDAAGGDAALYALLTDATPASRDGLSFVPAGALAAGSSHSDPAAWWDYLNGVVRKSPELGLSSLDELFSMLLGVDLRSLFFDWAGSDWTYANMGFTASVEPGMPSENLLGENLYIVNVTDEAKAKSGLDQLLSTLSMTIASFTDPFSDGSSSTATPSVDTEVQGVTVRTVTLSDGVTISYAITSGNLIFSTDATSVAASLEANASGDTLSGNLADLLAQVPADATSFGVSDDRAVTESVAADVGTQLQTFSALGMGAVDFDDLEAAGDSAEEFLRFVAARLGGSVTFSTVQDGRIVSSGFSEVAW